MRVAQAPLVAMALLLASGQEANAQIKPEAPVGSLIKRKPHTVGDAYAGAAIKSFARCAYRRRPAMAAKLMLHSDPMAIDHDRAEVSKIYERPQTALRECLGQQLRPEASTIELQIAPERLRILMMEEDYLARMPKASKVDPTAMPPSRAYVAIGDDLPKAQAIARFSDCIVMRDAVAADALLRTMPGSDDERSAARAMAATLGSCLLQGEQMKLTPKAVRTYAVEGLWARFSGVDAQPLGTAR